MIAFKNLLIISGLFFLYALNIAAQEPLVFEDYFTDQTMRLDYEHLGDAKTELLVLDRIYLNGFWSGSTTNLLDGFNFGFYRFSIKDAESGKLIFSKDFNSNYGEYRVTPEAKGGIIKSFHESALFPAPLKPFFFTIDSKGLDGSYKLIFERQIDPEGIEIIRNEQNDPDVMVFTSLYNGDSHHKVDVVYVAEGYDASELAKFEQDLRHFTEALFRKKALKNVKDRFNVWGVFKASPESGVDQPRHNSFKKTNIGASFNAFNIERYLLIEDNKTLRDIAGHAPYDALFILVNHARYGGAGMYNLYCTMTADNVYSDFLMVHEFGHSFFGLADEYYTSEVGFDDLYGAEYEPFEANITSLKDSSKLKWAQLAEKGIPLPTPWEKDKYDAADKAWQKERHALKEHIADLEKNGAPEAEFEAAKLDFAVRDKAHAEKMYNWLHRGKYAGKVGAFEGAGYISEGMFRPTLDCIMFSKKADEFCPVCEASMLKIIDWYTE